MTPKAARYRGGECDVFALALHQVTGWPLALIEGVRPDPDAPGDVIGEPAHAVALSPGRWLADVDGLHRRADLVAHCRFSVRPSRVRVRRVSPEECAETFTTAPVDPGAIAEAVALIREMPARWARPGAHACLVAG